MIMFIGIILFVIVLVGILWLGNYFEKEDRIHNETIKNQTTETDLNTKNKCIDFQIWKELSQEQKTIIKKRERSRMTSKLREKIKIRDNYTCQCCGRYMPDGFGIHIDHIIPISKGGLSVEENLQVLCINCNLKKSNK